MRKLSLAERRWNDLWARLGVTDKAWVRRQFRRMLKRYGERHRAYHIWDHIEYGLDMLFRHAHLAENFDAILIAWFLHDIVYHTKTRGKRALSNETLSANYADRLLRRAGVPAEFRAMVRDLILATLHNPELVTTRDQMLMVDIDWSVLGWPWERYIVYVAKVRREYAKYTDKAFGIGRLGWIAKARWRDRHFHLDEFNDAYNEQVKANLAREAKEYEDVDFAKNWELP